MPAVTLGAPRPLPTVAGRGDAQVERLFHGAIRDLAFVDGRLLLALDDRIECLDAATLEAVEAWPLRGVYVLQGLPDGRVLVVRRAGAGSEVLVGRLGGEPLGFRAWAQVVRTDKPLGDVVATPDGQRIVVPTDRGVRVFDGSGAEIAALEAESEPFSGPSDQAAARVAVSPSGRAVARWERMKDGLIWVDGEPLRQHVWGTRDGVPFEGQAIVRFTGVQFPDDERAVCNGGVFALDGVVRLAPVDAAPQRRVHAGRVVAADGFGGYVRLDPTTFAAAERAAGDPSHYGSHSVAHRLLAVDDRAVASYAPTYGRLFVHGPAGRVVREGHHEQLSGLQASRDGRCLVVTSAYRECGLVVDRVANTVAEIAAPEGLAALGLLDDGRRAVLAAGNNLAPRTVYVVDLATGSSEATHKSTTFPLATLALSATHYLHAARSHSHTAWVAAFEAGTARPVFELALEPWRIAVSGDGSAFAVVPGRGPATVRSTGEGTPPLLGSHAGALADASDVALGRTADTVAWIASGQRHLRHHGVTHTAPVDGLPDSHGGFAFSEDDAVLYHALHDGIALVDTATGEPRGRLDCGRVVALVARGGLLFALGDDGTIRAFRVPPAGGEPA